MVAIGFETAARSINSTYEYSFPSLAQARRHSCRTQRPGMFLRKRMVPATPTSFVKFAARECSLMTGAGSSTPMRDQVPELMKHQLSPSGAGTAATADAVSCDPVV